MNNVKIVTTLQNEAGSVTLKSVELEGDASQNLEPQAIDIGTVNKEITLVLDTAKVLAIGIGCIKTRGQGSELAAELTIKTNSTVTPNDTFVITPQNGLGWSSGDPTVIPLTVDVTKIYVTNTGTAKADLFIRILTDATP